MQFLRNQNLTGFRVALSTLSIMILRNLSYRCPDAREKTLIVSPARSDRASTPGGGGGAATVPIAPDRYNAPQLPSSGSGASGRASSPSS